MISRRRLGAFLAGMLLCGLTAVACRPHPAPAPAPGFYFWSTNFNFSDADARLADSTGFRALYLRLFDVDWDYNAGEATPRGRLSLPDTLPDLAAFDVTPVVFIVNRVFREEAAPAELAQKVTGAINRATAKYPALAAAHRWQIDCDWTPGTRDAYFAFLRYLRQLHPERLLSVTVRLHQYRERANNGIPPAQEGLLMCYNFAPVGEAATDNAIFDPALLRGYLKAPPYPLPLNAALPTFEWGAAFRTGRFLGLTPVPDLLGTTPVGKNRFLLTADTTVAGKFLRAGDVIRYDGPQTAGNLRGAAALLRERPEINDLLFFDHQPELWRRYGVESLIDEFYRP